MTGIPNITTTGAELYNQLVIDEVQFRHHYEAFVQPRRIGTYLCAVCCVLCAACSASQSYVTLLTILLPHDDETMYDILCHDLFVDEKNRILTPL